MFVDTKGVIRRCKSKTNRQNNGLKGQKDNHILNQYSSRFLFVFKFVLPFIVKKNELDD